MRRRGVSPDLALESERFLRQLDEAAFAASGSLPGRRGAARGAALSEGRWRCAAAHADRRFAPSSSSACSRWASRRRTRTTRPRRVAPSIRASTAYERHDFVTAREAFIAAVASDPTAPDAWADLGTASWAVADTARSVAAWQRALRLEPLASDVRDRVELVHALPWSSAGYVPPLPATWVFNLAGAALARRVGARHVPRARAIVRSASRTMITLGVVAAVMAIGGFALNERLSGQAPRRHAPHGIAQHRSAARRRAWRDGDHRRSRARDRVARARGAAFVSTTAATDGSRARRSCRSTRATPNRFARTKRVRVADGD